MRLIFSLLNFAFTLMLALIAFTYAAIEFPVTMQDLMTRVNHIHDRISYLVLPEDSMVWADIFLWSNLIVFGGFVLAVQFAKDLLRIIFGGRHPSPAPPPPPKHDEEGL